MKKFLLFILCGTLFCSESDKVITTSQIVPLKKRKSYRCDFENCGKSFLQKNDHKRHTRTHTGEKPFECFFCKKKFTQKGNKTKHEQKNHFKKMFQCMHQKCNKLYTTSLDLEKHVAIAHLNK